MDIKNPNHKEVVTGRFIKAHKFSELLRKEIQDEKINVILDDPSNLPDILNTEDKIRAAISLERQNQKITPDNDGK